MSRKGYDKAYCSQCNCKMIRCRVFGGKKGWGCPHCGFHTTGRAAELPRWRDDK